MSRVNLALCLLLLPVGPTLKGEEPPNEPPPASRTRDGAGIGYFGTVTEVTKTSITIRWPSPGVLPKEFSVSDDLASGRIPMKSRVAPNVPRGYHVSPAFMYRLADVKVGDWVSIEYAHLGDADICDHICIRKRPGGRVPPLPEEAEKLMNPREIFKRKFPDTQLPPPLKVGGYIPYHERMNAHWDLEDKGIPYPEKFGHKRRWPVAPMPREK